MTLKSGNTTPYILLPYFKQEFPNLDLLGHVHRKISVYIYNHTNKLKDNKYKMKVYKVHKLPHCGRSPYFSVNIVSADNDWVNPNEVSRSLYTGKIFTCVKRVQHIF